MTRRVEVPYEQVVAWLKAYAATLAENKEYLTELDSAIGDADHGINMDRGFTAARAKVGDLPDDADLGTVAKTVGMTLISTVGGASPSPYILSSINTCSLMRSRASLGSSASARKIASTFARSCWYGVRIGRGGAA